MGLKFHLYIHNFCVNFGVAISTYNNAFLRFSKSAYGIPLYRMK